jgi:uncharacterized protein YceH (UPF0502 family)
MKGSIHLDVVLNEYELRVLGVLVEKQIATPDYYPLSLNAVTNGCNQKNQRDPVVSYDETTVTRAMDGLKEKKLAYAFHGSEARVPKYGHLFPKAFELNDAEVAVMCVLNLRGPQTPGELRSRTSHLYNFEQLSDVENTLQNLSSRERPLVVRLARLPGARESRYAHLLGGPVSLDDVAPSPPSLRVEPTTPRPPAPPADDGRLARLEDEIKSMRREIDELKREFTNFKSQFE